jgi:U3 small nucleolar RNA-associated protein 22
MTMPSDMFNERDIKSGRYFDKRTVYCGELARQLSKTLPAYEVKVDFGAGNKNKAIVVVSVPNSAWKVQLIPCITPSTFPETKLTADYKNLSESTACDPHYNASILEDMYFGKDVFSAPRHLHFARAVQLVKVWLYRRGLLTVAFGNQAGLSGYQIRVLLSHLCQNLPKEVSAYQLFKLFLSLLTKTEWSKSVVVYGSSTSRLGAGLAVPTIECCQLGSYNPLWSVPLAVMSELSFEASQGLELLDDMTVSDPFDALFCRASRERDFTISFRTEQTLKSAESVGSMLTTALGNRLYRKQIYLRYLSDGSVTVSGDIDSSSISTWVEKGPSADSAEAQSFRAFWGKKAELRRFKDGSILECVVWPSDMRVSAAEQIIRFVLEHKLAGKIENPNISFCPLGSCKGITKTHVEVWTGMEELRVKLTSIEKLPISIVSLRPAHARFTGTDLGGVAPLDCVVEFETSTSWPTHRVAIWHSKSAFLLAMREGLMKQYCAVEIAAEEVSEEPFIDVRLVGGKFENFAFRLRIFANVEKDRLYQLIASVDSPPSLAEIATVSQLWFEPMLRARIHAISATCPALSAAIVQAKSWLDNHLMLEPWLSEWTEVTMAHVVESKRGYIPQSAHVLFLDWLFFVAQHAYQSTPVFAKLAGEVSEDVLSVKYEDSVESRRSWWISSDIDPDCLFLRRPTGWEAERIQKLAKRALERAETREWQLIKSGTDNGQVFDVIVKIKAHHTNQMDEYVKILTEQFRKYLSIAYSKRHGLIGVKMEPSAFRPQSKTVLEKSKMLTVVDGVAVPDVIAITSKLGALLQGVVESIRVRD